MDKSIKISVALIVKNEEPILAECLESVKDADEIIVVDTGSTDNTIEIAKQYTDNIYNFEWCDDFSKARNFANSKCSNEWILSIDADHTLQTPISKVKKEIAKAKEDVLKIKSIYGNNTYNRAVIYKKHINWVGAVHEVLSKPTNEVIDVVEHITYSDSHKHDTNRNLRILTKSDLSVPRNQFYLAREYLDRSDYKNATKAFIDYLKIATWTPEKAEAYLCLAKIHWWTMKGDKARAYCLQAINQNPMFKEALLLMAEMHYEPYKTKWDKLAELADNTDVLFIRN